jgi:hypothetical protein
MGRASRSVAAPRGAGVSGWLNVARASGDHRGGFFLQIGAEILMKIRRILVAGGAGFLGSIPPDDVRVVSTFLVQALRGEPITVVGDDLQTPAFCYRDDRVGDLIQWMDSPDHVTGPINRGNPGEFPWLERAHHVIAMTGSRSRIEHRSLPPDDPRQRQPSAERAHRLLGWAPRKDLEAGLRQTIAYITAIGHGFSAPRAARPD